MFFFFISSSFSLTWGVFELPKVPPALYTLFCSAGSNFMLFSFETILLEFDAPKLVFLLNWLSSKVSFSKSMSLIFLAWTFPLAGPNALFLDKIKKIQEKGKKLFLEGHIKALSHCIGLILQVTHKLFLLFAFRLGNFNRFGFLCVLVGFGITFVCVGRNRFCVFHWKQCFKDVFHLNKPKMFQYPFRIINCLSVEVLFIFLDGRVLVIYGVVHQGSVLLEELHCLSIASCFHDKNLFLGPCVKC